jgi:hypothetical protein
MGGGGLVEVEMCNGMEEEPWVVVVETCSSMVVEKNA